MYLQKGFRCEHLNIITIEIPSINSNQKITIVNYCALVLQTVLKVIELRIVNSRTNLFMVQIYHRNQFKHTVHNIP